MIKVKRGYNVRSKEELSHRDFVRETLKKYRQMGLQPGNPEDGIWNQAHFPLPSRLGHLETVDLLFEDHQVQGLLQSEEFGLCCFFPAHTKRFLDRGFCEDWFNLYDIYDKWSSVHAKESCRSGHQVQKDKGLGFFSNRVQKIAQRKSLESRKKNGTLGNGYRMNSNKAREAALTLWECLKTGKVMNAGNLTQYQRRNGIDTTMRKRHGQGNPP